LLCAFLSKLLFKRLSVIFFARMNHPLYVIGIEGGGTKTVAVLCALDGSILVEEREEASNVQIGGPERAASVILRLIDRCCHGIGCDISQIGAVVAGLAGAGRPGDQQLAHDCVIELARKQDLAIQELQIESDARIALEGAFGGKPGIVVIAGTGSIVFGKDGKGRLFKGGGWGRLIGDEGSGYSIGQAAFRAITRTLDKRGARTRLLKLFEEKFGLGTQEAVIDALYRQNFAVASVVPVVIQAAAGGDTIARDILRSACSELADVLASVVVRMKKGTRSAVKQPLAFVGSLLTSENAYSRMLRSALRRKLPDIVIRPAEFSPVVGAALMAIEQVRK
jgi:N-acetylglucosamine kinase-like BadF-type ATPase